MFRLSTFRTEARLKTFSNTRGNCFAKLRVVISFAKASFMADFRSSNVLVSDFGVKQILKPVFIH
jgi:hypothetical protein